MALGMAKDSMVDLQSLVQGKNDTITDGSGADTLSLLTTGQSRRCTSEYEKLSRKTTPNPALDDPPPTVEKQVASRSLSVTLDGESSAPALPASPQKPYHDPEEEKKQDSYSQYSGFANDYEDYSYDPYVVDYPQTLLGGKNASPFGTLLCCIFPWLRSDPNVRITAHGQQQLNTITTAGQQQQQESVAITTTVPSSEGSSNSEEPMRKSSSLGEDDDLSTGDASAASDKLGERLSEKDRQAVLARLRLAQPDRSSHTSAADAAGTPGSLGRDKVQQKGLLNEIPNESGASAALLNDSKSDQVANKGGQKGILKRQMTVIKNPEPEMDTSGIRRRSLFPTYETGKVKKNTHHVQFSPMARVVTVKSQKDMTPEEKGSVWWQKWDYEDFRKTGRIITRAMLEGGSEIWLASNQSWQHQGSSKQATLQSAMSLSDQAAKKLANGTKTHNTAAVDVLRNEGDKWWHKFGHSRRGLEHIASIKEGSERQANVRHAIRAVLDEQQRQKAYRREDPEKLRMVSIHNTAWARDLAVAAGSSDADAVTRNFDEERKSREFYLLKMARSNSISSKGKHVPAFMQPALNTSYAQKLDAHTSAQIMYRQKSQRAMLQVQAQAREAKEAAAPPTKCASIPPLTMSKIIVDSDTPKKEGSKDLAKRAAGFSHDGAEQVNMAAVLSGMGPVPKNAPLVGA